jgi:long-subunit acyl-CoA synthetase (AMP-forming)
MTSQIQAFNTVSEPLVRGDVILGILPFSHIYGLTLLVHQPLTRAVPVVVLPRFDEVQFLEAIQKVSPLRLRYLTTSIK